MPIRHGGRLASRVSTCPRDHFCRSTIAPRRSWPTTWNEFLPISMPITAIALLSFSDMACSLTLVPRGQFRLLAGAGARPDHPISGVGTVVGAADIMQGCADAGEAPLLIDAQVGDDVRHPEAEGAGSLSEALDRERVVGDDRGGRDQREAVHRQVHRAPLAGGGVFERDGAGEAVAELGGVGPEV